MGPFRVRAHLTGPTGRSETVELLVDTGATFLVVPRALAPRRGAVASGRPRGDDALESLLLAADPVAKRLVPVEGFVGVA